MEIEELREQFRPIRTRVLLVGESPPANGVFFYEGCRMTTFTKDAFEKAIGNSFQSNMGFFTFMKQSGFYLDDVSQVPVNHLPTNIRRATLVGQSEKFAERVVLMNPQVVVVLLKSIESIVREALGRVDFSAQIYALPFPGNGHQVNYVNQLIPIVKEYSKSA